MPINRVACSHCNAVLKTARELPLGKQVKCPQCSRMFTVTSDAIQAATAGLATAGAQPAGRFGSDVQSAGSGVSGLAGTSEATPGQPGNRRRALLWLLLGSVLFLGTGGGLAYVCFSGGKSGAPDNDKEASLGKSNADSSSKNTTTTGSSKKPDEADHMGGGGRGDAGALVTALPEDEQKAVDKAIEQGVAWLKNKAQPAGTWGTQKWRVGHAAFPGMTLLMCGVPATDPAVQNAAKFVRGAAPQLNGTYELALSIMFLDQLGDPQDKELIQTLALRLVAGQAASGGWNYSCPLLSPGDLQKLVGILKDQRSRDSWADVASSITGQDKLVSIGGETIPQDTSKLLFKQATESEPLPAALKKLPVLQEQKINEQLLKDPAQTDNSNTQFALLALWIARKYDVPLNRTMVLVSRRFRASQNANGGWGYHYTKQGPTPPMTCAGLLGLAVGHGVASEVEGARAQPPLKDPAVKNGLHELTKSVGKPLPKGEKRAINLYFLWSLERVAVVYNLSKFEDKDWYRWASQILVANQGKDGNWSNGQYYSANPVIDTCMALLVLKRANVVSDLTDKLQLFSDANK